MCVVDGQLGFADLFHLALHVFICSIQYAVGYRKLLLRFSPCVENYSSYVLSSSENGLFDLLTGWVFLQEACPFPGLFFEAIAT